LIRVVSGGQKKRKKLKNRHTTRNAVGINLSPEVVDYFKGLADETGLPLPEID
jgi:hypothetical protein